MKTWPMGNGSATLMIRGVTQKEYDKARRALAVYAVDERNMRIVEQGAIEFGQARMREAWMRALREKGHDDLAAYLGVFKHLGGTGRPAQRKR